MSVKGRPAGTVFAEAPARPRAHPCLGQRPSVSTQPRLVANVISNSCLSTQQKPVVTIWACILSGQGQASYLSDCWEWFLTSAVKDCKALLSQNLTHGFDALHARAAALGAYPLSHVLDHPRNRMHSPSNAQHVSVLGANAILCKGAWCSGCK